MSASWSTTATHWYFDLSFSTDFIAACLGFSSAGGRGNDTYRLHKIIRHESTNKYADRVLRVFLFEGHKRQVTIGPVNVTVGCPGRFRAGIESMSSCRLSATCVTRGLRCASCGNKANEFLSFILRRVRSQDEVLQKVFRRADEGQT